MQTFLSICKLRLLDIFTFVKSICFRFAQTRYDMNSHRVSDISSCLQHIESERHIENSSEFISMRCYASHIRFRCRTFLYQVRAKNLFIKHQCSLFCFLLKPLANYGSVYALHKGVRFFILSQSIILSPAESEISFSDGTVKVSGFFTVKSTVSTALRVPFS